MTVFVSLHGSAPAHHPATLIQWYKDGAYEDVLTHLLRSESFNAKHSRFADAITTAIYQAVLFKDPSQTKKNKIRSQIKKNGIEGAETLAHKLLDSAAFGRIQTKKTAEAQVKQLYQQLWGRSPTATELKKKSARIRKGKTAGLVSALLESDEFFSLYTDLAVFE